MAREPRGKYYEDMNVGDVYPTGQRTVTATDIVNFACLTGDFNEVHSNHEFVKNTEHGEPIAHGPLVYAICGGLSYATGNSEGTLLALLGIDNWRMLKTVKHGDTIFMEEEVTAKRLTSKPGRGVITFDRRIINQRGEIVHTMTANKLYKCREG
ncbi:MaoC/PaaZ C-terminal domain-containing protein [Sporichthya sp.]|uniref:MaoC/PaaZ C-terminal domain-containing protein n=1 Tax=Sporichthya sp. TaxID=65475 RepID=UPI00179E7283|nr:MaoC/PaaZ C-terminal domain-containing protein [Sporichthya sp.]MBA3741378.1 MaoC family dehydratase N-terminal domain-containing protein [Sporichthya sp.]